jgi:deazaflavin-dependent oxidoreductase (nitroreductase family)
MMADVDDFNTKIIEEFRSNGGKVGGQFEGAPVLLLTTAGAKSGKTRENPMMYLAEGDRIYVFASKGGAPTNPDWYHNLVAHPTVTVELGTDRFEAVATPVDKAERDRIYAEHASRYPGFADYEAKTDRVIPVVALERQ